MCGGGFLRGQEKCKIYSSVKLHKCNILHLFGEFSIDGRRVLALFSGFGEFVFFDFLVDGWAAYSQ